MADASTSVDVVAADLTARARVRDAALHPQLTRTLAIDTLAPSGMSRVSAAMWDFVSPSLVGEHLAEAGRRRPSPGPDA